MNPWLGSEWQIYNEYYQWSPSHNFNSASHVVKAGDVLYGSITYVPANNSYTIFHSSKSDGWSVSTNIAVQMDRSGVTKNYSIAYFVYEKTAPCGDYPPDGIVTFYNISVAYDGKDATNAVAYKTAFVDDVCNNRATVVDQRTIKVRLGGRQCPPNPTHPEVGCARTRYTRTARMPHTRRSRGTRPRLTRRLRSSPAARPRRVSAAACLRPCEGGLCARTSLTDEVAAGTLTGAVRTD